MFQSYALFPHMNVEQNVAFGLKQDRVPKAQIAERVATMLDLVKLGSFAKRGNADKLVAQLKALGHSAYVAPQGSGRAQRYRVRVGPAADRAAAERVLTRLKGQGHGGSVVGPGTK